MTKEDRIESLDSLRGIAAVFVVIFHCLITFTTFNNANFKHDYSNVFLKWFTLPPLHTIWAGYEAVILFFILSGFVLSLPFLDNRAPTYRNYIIRRFCRIYIPYIVMMIVATLLVSFVATYQNYPNLSNTFNNRWDHPVSAKAIVAYLLMVDYDNANVNGVIWSLIHEMRISIIFPLLMLIVRKMDFKRLVLVSLLVPYLLYFSLKLIASMIHIESVFFLIGNTADTCFFAVFFLFGAILAKYRKNIVDFIKLSRTLTKVALIVCATILFNFRSIYFFNKIVIDDLITSFGVIIIITLALSSPRFQTFLSLRYLKWLGKISYSLYLTHILVFMLTITFLPKFIPLTASILIAPVFTLPIAYITYKLIEYPSNQLGKYLVTARKKAKSKEKIATA